MTPLIELSQVSFDYDDGDQRFRALHSVDLRIFRGEFVAILGASGSGKSTMLNILGLLAPPTLGQYRLNGVDTGQFDETERAQQRGENIGFVFQQFNLLSRLSARENILVPTTFLANCAADTRRALKERAESLLASLGVADRAERLPSEMSGGQKQRVAICRALVLDPAIVLADEPTGALDAQTTREVLAILETLNAQGKTVIIITHDPEVARHARRQIVLKDGHVVSDSGANIAAPETSSSLHTAQSARNGMIQVLASAREWVAQSRFAWRTLAAHKLRSFLTGLGLLIGVTSIVFVAGLGEMADRTFRALFLSPMTQKVYIMPDRHGPGRQSSHYWAGLDSDREFPVFQQRFEKFGTIRPNLNTDSCTVTSESRSTRTRLQGVFDAEEYREMDTPLQAGRFPSEMEIRSGLPVVVLGSGAVDSLFAPTWPGRSRKNFPVGEKISATNCKISQTFTVVGALKAQDLMFMRTDANELLYAPTPSLIAAGASGTFRGGFSAMPKPGVEPRWLADSLANYLSLRDEGKQPFRTMVPAEVLSKVRMMLTVLQALTGFIGFLCMAVGGIGIMNIMLVSVRERIREIGVSKSLGATPRQIKSQFLTESVLLCLGAGVLGVAVGFVSNNLIALALSLAFPNLGPFAWVVALPGIGLAVVVAVLCGMGFGLYPALRAARVNPAECLREE